jgi:hypothetical protein
MVAGDFTVDDVDDGIFNLLMMNWKSDFQSTNYNMSGLVGDG